MSSMDLFLGQIHTNLKLLKEKGYKISFEKETFRNRNELEFVNIGHALLLIIDPDECKKNIPWPIHADRKMKHEFRVKFVQFIKRINEKNADAQIPEMVASTLQNPGGEKFIRFMYKLSTFALKVEMKKMMGTEEYENLLPPPQPSSITDNMVKLRIVKGAKLKMEQSANQLLELKAAYTEKLGQLKKIDTHLAEKLITEQNKLAKEISNLPPNSEVIKARLNDIEDHDVMTDWNDKIEAKIEEIEGITERFCKVRDLSATACDLLKSADRRNGDSLCLDGYRLHISPAVSQLAGGPVTNAQGQLRLEVLLAASASLAQRLVPSTHHTTQEPLLPRAQSLLNEVRQQQATAESISQSLRKLIAESKEVEGSLLPVLHDQMRNKAVPEHIRCLEDRKPMKFNFTDTRLQCSPQKRNKRLSLNTLTNTKRMYLRRPTYLIKRRPPLPHSCFNYTPRHQTTPAVAYSEYSMPITSTAIRTSYLQMTGRKSYLATTVEPRARVVPVKPTPACKRSIYGKLPTGLRVQDEEETLASDFENFTQTNAASDSSFLENTVNSSFRNEIPHEPASPPKRPRKSLQNLIDRYKNLKTSMARETTKRD